RISSQEPRRPRFSFFLSSQCQRADPSSSPTDTSNGSGASYIRSGKQDPSSGCPADRLPCQKALISGSGWRSASSTLAGYSQNQEARQHPIFEFQQNRNPKTKTKFSFVFSPLLSSFASCGAAVSSDEPGYRGHFPTCKALSTRRMRFSAKSLRPNVQN